MECLKNSEIAKPIIKRTVEHEYAILDGYLHMLINANEGNKTSLKLADKERFKYFGILWSLD